MVKMKSQSKKTQKRGVDFKKIRRKVGRKLPPAKNATNTEIKSKAIILPEQSIASEKSGLATSRKGLTLKELLQQTSHHNAKVRKEALIGIKDILTKHPAELKLHKLAVVEKLRERIGDDDKLVRETLYQLFKSVIFPGCAKDNQGPFVSLIMAYVFNAMTHLAVDVRMMAFKFVELIIQFYPSSFSMYGEKILRNYEDMLQKSLLLQDKSKLKSVLSGLVRCLSLLPCDDRERYSTVKNDNPVHNVVLHAFEPVVVRDLNGLTDMENKLKDLLPVLTGCIQDFLPSIQGISRLDVQSFDCLQLILQSIEFVVKFLANDTCGRQSDLQILPPVQLPHLSTHEKFISPMIFKKLWDIFPVSLVNEGKDNERIFILNMLVTQVFLQLSNWNYFSPDLMNKHLDFVELSLTKIQLGKAFYDKHLLPVIPYIPKLTMEISGDWRVRILQAFTEAFQNCAPDSLMKLACLSAIQEMLSPERSWLCKDVNDPAILDYQIAWIQGLPTLLMVLDDENPTCSKAVLQILLRIGQAAPVNSPFSEEFDKIQYKFKDFFSSRIGEAISYGPFMKLSADIQELAICCLYYFSFVDSRLLQSLVSCCLGNDLKPHMVFRILEVLHSAFAAGHMQVADYASFHVTLLSRFRVYPESISPGKYDGKSNQKTYKSITRIVCSCLSQIGDEQLLLQMLEKLIVDQICGEIPMENKCGFLRLLVTLDTKPSRLSDRSILNLNLVLPQYLLEAISNVDDRNVSDSDVKVKIRRYYLLPSFHLFHGSKRLLKLVFNVMVSWVSELSSSLEPDHSHVSMNCLTRVSAIGLMLSDMHKDAHVRQVLLSCKTELEIMTQNLQDFLLSEGTNLSLEENRKIGNAHEQIRAITL